MARLAIVFFFLATANALINSNNYDVVTKYNCWRDGEIYLDRGLIFKFEEVFLNNWPGNVAFDCEMPVANRYKYPGIISVIQHSNFRKAGATCVDHMKFYIYNQNYGREIGGEFICGEMALGQSLPNAGNKWSPPKFISEFSGPFISGSTSSRKLMPLGVSVNPRDVKIEIHVDGKPLNPGERLSFVIAFTGFIECDALNVPEGMFNCGYGVCILEMFVGDGIVNCPFGDCRDEGNCDEAMKDINMLTNGTYYGSSMIGNSTVATPVSRPFLKWLEKNKEGTEVSTARTERKVVQELEYIKDEIKRNTNYLERIIQMLGGNVTIPMKNMTVEL